MLFMSRKCRNKVRVHGHTKAAMSPIKHETNHIMPFSGGFSRSVLEYQHGVCPDISPQCTFKNTSAALRNVAIYLERLQWKAMRLKHMAIDISFHPPISA